MLRLSAVFLAVAAAAAAAAVTVPVAQSGQGFAHPGVFVSAGQLLYIRDQIHAPGGDADVAALQQLMEKIKDTVVGLKQEDLLRSIRASP
eukprot:COSAG04_NODE_3794_length_2525_cov_20.477741_3_plen_89_part_01